MKLDYTDIIKGPLISEKSTEQKDKNRMLCFKVHVDANKISIKKAVETLFNTSVESVQTAKFLGKIKKQGKSSGRRPSWKKAYVKLTKDANKVEYFEV